MRRSRQSFSQAGLLSRPCPSTPGSKLNCTAGLGVARLPFNKGTAARGSSNDFGVLLQTMKATMQALLTTSPFLCCASSVAVWNWQDCLGSGCADVADSPPVARFPHILGSRFQKLCSHIAWYLQAVSGFQGPCPCTWTCESLASHDALGVGFDSARE